MSMFIFFVVPAICMIPVGIYLYFFLKRAAAFWGLDITRRRVRVPILVLAVCMALACSYIWGMPAMVILHLVAVAAVMELLNGIYHLLWKNQIADGWRKLYSCGLVPVLVSALIIGYGYWNMGHVVRTDYTIETVKDIRAEGYRIALLSDLHFGTTMDAERLGEYCSEISQQNADVVVLCGDIVDENSTLEEMQAVFAQLGGITSAYGTYYVYGNHDKATYRSNPNFTREQLAQTISANGIQILEDEVAVVNDEFTIVGRQDAAYARVNERLSGAELMEQVDRKDFVLILDHQPLQLEANREAGYDLQLSGHTHAGQIWPVGLVSDILGFGEMNYGLRQMDSYHIVVTSGMAGWGYPIRTGAHSEYVIIQVQGMLKRDNR